MNTDYRLFAGFKLAISAYAAIWGTGFLSYLVMPHLIGSVADGMGLGVDPAGLIGSAESSMVALSAVVGWHINRKPRAASSGSTDPIAGWKL